MKAENSTDELILKLKGELKPVKPLPEPGWRWLLWFALSVGVVFGLMRMIKPFYRSWSELLAHPMFLLETGLALMSAVSCAYIAYRLSIPGRKVSRLTYALALAPGLGFFAMLFFAFSGMPESMAGKRDMCVFEILFFSWIPIGFMVWQLRKSYPFFFRRISLLVGLAGTAIPVALMQTACMYGRAHNLTWHLGPALVVTTIVIALSGWLLKPQRFV